MSSAAVPLSGTGGTAQSHTSIRGLPGMAMLILGEEGLQGRRSENKDSRHTKVGGALAARRRRRFSACPRVLMQPTMTSTESRSAFGSTPRIPDFIRMLSWGAGGRGRT